MMFQTSSGTSLHFTQHPFLTALYRHTLTDPTLVELLHEHGFVGWGGHVRESDAWSGVLSIFPYRLFTRAM